MLGQEQLPWQLHDFISLTMILCLVRRPLNCGGVSGAIQIGNLQFIIYNLCVLRCILCVSCECGEMEVYSCVKLCLFNCKRVALCRRFCSNKNNMFLNELPFCLFIQFWTPASSILWTTGWTPSTSTAFPRHFQPTPNPEQARKRLKPKSAKVLLSSPSSARTIIPSKRGWLPPTQADTCWPVTRGNIRKSSTKTGSNHSSTTLPGRQPTRTDITELVRTATDLKSEPVPSGSGRRTTGVPEPTRTSTAAYASLYRRKSTYEPHWCQPVT